MPKFTAKKIDLDLELTLANGEEKKITGPSIGYTEGRRIMEANTRREMDVQEKVAEQDQFFAFVEVHAQCLADIYGPEEYPPQWWVDNIDPTTIRDIIRYIAQEIIGAEKRGPSSKR